jgi:hypothetical protein
MRYTLRATTVPLAIELGKKGFEKRLYEDPDDLNYDIVTVSAFKTTGW